MTPRYPSKDPQAWTTAHELAFLRDLGTHAKGHSLTRSQLLQHYLAVVRVWPVGCEGAQCLAQARRLLVDGENSRVKGTK